LKGGGGEDSSADGAGNDGADIDELKVKTIYVEQGATLKRFSARAKGRGNRISKPTRRDLAGSRREPLRRPLLDVFGLHCVSPLFDVFNQLYTVSPLIEQGGHKKTAKPNDLAVS
jgi:hypothetical protein